MFHWEMSGLIAISNLRRMDERGRGIWISWFCTTMGGIIGALSSFVSCWRNHGTCRAIQQKSGNEVSCNGSEKIDLMDYVGLLSCILAMLIGFAYWSSRVPLDWAWVPLDWAWVLWYFGNCTEVLLGAKKDFFKDQENGIYIYIYLLMCR